MKAFPNEHPISGTMNTFADGMDLRDYFAAKALPICMSDWIQVQKDNEEIVYLNLEHGTGDAEIIAKEAYAMADAMMKARNV